MSEREPARRGISALFGLGKGGGAESDQVHRLLEINRALVSEREPARLYARILDAAVELTGAERAFLVLAAPGAPEPEVVASRNIDREEVRSPGGKVSRTVVRKVVESGESQLIESAVEDSSLRPSASISEMRLVSILALPLRARGAVTGCLYLDNRFQKGKFTPDHRALMELFADQAAIAVENARLHAQEAAARAELEKLNERLAARVADQTAELASMREAIESRYEPRPLRHEYPGIVGTSPAMQEMLHLLDVVVETDYAVLILGESGTGKEAIARAIHRLGRRRDRPFVAENCAAIAENLLEAELFGHVRGAFTGADRDRSGLFEEANGGTLFLDEIGDMELAMQAKLLRVLQEGEFRKVGGRDPIRVDVRILSATNADLSRRLEEGRFREDLYFRLKVMSVRVPPLRERRGDVPLLVGHFLEEAAREAGRAPAAIDDEALARLVAYSWPGNVRELRNEVFKLDALAAGEKGGRIGGALLKGLGEGLKPAHLPLAGRTLAEIEKDAIRQALEVAHGKRVEAARLLGLPRRTFYNRLKRHGFL